MRDETKISARKKVLGKQTFREKEWVSRFPRLFKKLTILTALRKKVNLTRLYSVTTLNGALHSLGCCDPEYQYKGVQVIKIFGNFS